MQLRDRILPRERGEQFGQEDFQSTSGLTNCFRCRISTVLGSELVPVFVAPTSAFCCCCGPSGLLQIKMPGNCYVRRTKLTNGHSNSDNGFNLTVGSEAQCKIRVELTSNLPYARCPGKLGETRSLRRSRYAHFSLKLKATLTYGNTVNNLARFSMEE